MTPGSSLTNGVKVSGDNPAEVPVCPTANHPTVPLTLKIQNGETLHPPCAEPLCHAGCGQGNEQFPPLWSVLSCSGVALTPLGLTGRTKAEVFPSVTYYLLVTGEVALK